MKTSNQTNSRFHRGILITSIAFLMFGPAVVQADDVEIYLTTPPEKVPPNVLFVLDESGSMEGDRLDDLKEAMTTILEDEANENIKAGILAYTLDRYDGDYWDSIRAIYNFALIKDNKTDMVTKVDGLDAVSGTPSVKALADAVDWFKSGFSDTEHNIVDSNQTFPSPLSGDEEGNWCKKNHIVFMTDGRPNSNNPDSSLVTATWALSEYPVADSDSDPSNDVAAACNPTSPTWAATTIKTDTNDYEYLGGLCAGEIAEWAYNTDLKDWKEKQNIVTHTVGLDIGNPSAEKDFLDNVALKGGGGSYLATGTAGLTLAFKTILESASTSIPYTYSSPTIPYNPDNSAVSDDFIYVPMFSPLAKNYWKGNLKKYRIAVDDTGGLTVVDRNETPVVDDTFSFINDTQDFWTSEANSGQVYLGGAVSNMSGSTAEVSKRNLYTWLEGSSTDLTATVVTVDPNGDAVTISPNRVHTNNIVITAGMVDVDAVTDSDKAIERSEYLNWVNWIGDAPSEDSEVPYTRNDNFPAPTNVDPNAEPDGVREYMGAPIHTTPLVTRYSPSYSFTDVDSVVDGENDSINLGSTNPWSDGDLVVYSGTGLALEDGGFLADGEEYKVITGSGTIIQLAFIGDEGDPLTPIDLADSSNSGELHSFTTSNAIDVVLMTTSEGVLHAFYGGSDKVTTNDTVVAGNDGGVELWSFMPRRFLSNIKDLRDNDDAERPHYGLDGPLTVYESLDASTGEMKKYVVMTMRRGGRDIYALDITDINSPKMAWEIIGGTTTGFERLGQTWSEVQFLKMELNGTESDVLVFGGGYDTKQDPDQDGVIPTSRVDDDMGNAIFVVDPATGARLAYFTADTTTSDPGDTDDTENRLQVTGMENGIIGILPVDINNNGITDRLYASGVGGRIFRIDIPDSGFTSTTITGGLIADVNGSPGNPSGNNDFQRFFNEPEVAYYSRGGVTFLGILIGSGYRPSPLDNTVKDRFYMIKDFSAFTIPSSYSTITEGDLYDASLNYIQDGDEDEQEAAASALATSDGWFIDLLDEENDQKQKVFSEARIFESVILFSTYQEVSGVVNTDVCSATSSQGESHVYALNLIDGSAVLDLSEAVVDLETVEEGLEEGTITINATDRSIGLNIQGLPPTPVIVFPDPGTGEVTLSGRSAVAIVGLEAVFRFPDRFFPVNWEEVIDTGVTQTQ